MKVIEIILSAAGALVAAARDIIKFISYICNLKKKRQRA